MVKLGSLFAFWVLASSVLLSAHAQNFWAGASKINATLPIGVPLAGYNHGERRVPEWPIPKNTLYGTFLNPSQGIIEPTWVRALVIDDGKGERVCFVTLDMMSSDSSLNFLAHLMAKAQGFTVPFAKVTFSASHTHSGPATYIPQFIIQVTPTTDTFVPENQRRLANHIANAMLEAERNLQPAMIGISGTQVWNVTYNRRSNGNPYLNYTSIDPNVEILSVNDMKGTPIATLWNFAIHGVCYGPSNMNYSGDIMGVGCQVIEESGGGIALFINGDAGDISPTSAACANPPAFTGGINLGNAVMQTRKTNTTFYQSGKIYAGSYKFNIGLTETNWTLARDLNCTEGGPLDICSICEKLDCDLNIRAGVAWTEEWPRFTSFRFSVGPQEVLFVSIPGEALSTLGFQIRNDSALMGFDRTFLVGYSNNYLYYFATPEQYLLGGYESNLTVFGYYTAEIIRAACDKAALQVKPSNSTLLKKGKKLEFDLNATIHPEVLKRLPETGVSEEGEFALL